MNLPIKVQRIESAVILVAAIIGYAATGKSWWLFALLLLVPDVSMLGYLGGNVLGAWCYNIGHSYALPIILLVLAIGYKSYIWLAIALIWLAHIAMDRSLGYGLKLTTGFKHTNLGEIGRKAQS